MALDGRLLGPRIESYWVEVLDADDQVIGTLLASNSCVVDGSVNWNLDATIKGGCSLTFLNPPSWVDFATNRFRPWVLVNNLRWPLGVYIPQSPSYQHSATGTTVTVACMDKTWLVDRIKVQGRSISPYQAQGGLPMYVRANLANITGEPIQQIMVTPSSRGLRSTLTWEDGTSWLQMLNDCLAALNYNSLWCDRWGKFHAEPWQDPALVSPVHVFAEGETAIHSADFTVDQDTAAVPNQVVCTTQGDDKTHGMIATVDLPASSKFSAANRGGQVVTAYYSEEASDFATLQSIAWKHLTASQKPPESISVSHAVVPLWGRDVLRFTSDGVDRLVTVNEWSIPSFKAGALMTGKWTAVAA